MSTTYPDGKKLEQNCAILADRILQVIESSKPHSHHAWDSFAGRMVYHEQSLRDAKKQAVASFLIELLKEEPKAQ